MNRRMFNSILSHYSLGANSIPQLQQAKTSANIAKCHLGSKLPPGENTALSKSDFQTWNHQEKYGKGFMEYFKH